MGFWVFGYGSLVWNPGFEYDEKVIGFVRDYRRVFDVGMFSSPHKNPNFVKWELLKITVMLYVCESVCLRLPLDC